MRNNVITQNPRGLINTNPFSEALGENGGSRAGEGGLEGRVISVGANQSGESLALSREQSAQTLREPRSIEVDYESDTEYFSCESDDDEWSGDEYLADEGFLNPGKPKNVATSARREDVFVALTKDEEAAVVSTNPFDVLIAAKIRAASQKTSFDVMGAIKNAGDTSTNPFDEMIVRANLIATAGDVPLGSAKAAQNLASESGNSQGINGSDAQRQNIGVADYNPFGSGEIGIPKAQLKNASSLGQATVSDGAKRNETMSISARIHAAFQNFFAAVAKFISDNQESAKQVFKGIALFGAFLQDVDYLVNGGDVPLHHYAAFSGIFDD